MPFLRSRSFLAYAAGLGCVAVGAQVSSMVHSMWPLALGASAAVMTTWGLVRAIRERGRGRSRG